MEDGSYRSQAHNRISATGFTRSPGTWIWSRVLLLQNIFPPSERPTKAVCSVQNRCGTIHTQSMQATP